MDTSGLALKSVRYGQSHEPTLGAGPGWPFPGRRPWGDGSIAGREPEAHDRHVGTGAEAVLHLMRIAVVLVRSDGCVVLANRAAATLLASADGLAISGGRLRARDKAVARRLARLLSGEPGDPTLGGVVRVPRDSGLPFALLVVPLGQEATATRAVFLCDRDCELEASDRLLVELYGLTPAEARVARLLARGSSPARAAAELGVSVATVRAQLKQVFAKTQTCRQSELVSVLLSGPSLLAPA